MGMDRRPFVAALVALEVPVGFALGFVAAALATEPTEELGATSLAGAVIKTLAVLGMVGLLAWLAFRRRGTVWAPLWVATAVAMPSWLVFMGDEVGAPGLALALAWAGLALFLTVTERAALALGGLLAVFMSPSTEEQWALALFAMALIGVAFGPGRIRRVAAPFGAIGSMGVSVWFDWPGAADQAGRGDVWVLGLMAAGCIVAAAMAVLPRDLPAAPVSSP